MEANRNPGDDGPGRKLPAVTVVLPFRGDSEGLAATVEALQAHAGAAAAVLLIDDASPDPGTKARVEARIAGLPRFRCVRNPSELGWAESCNRAAYELDPGGNDLLLLRPGAVPTAGFLEELSACLHASEHHSVACPRSDRGGFLALPPVMPVPPAPARARECWERLKDRLPRFHPIPTAAGSCLLVRREVVANFGLFDPAYGPGEGCEDDFAQRIGALGYSAVAANRAFVHLGEPPPVGDRTRLAERHPELGPELERWLARGQSGREYFADVLGRAWPRPRILLDLDLIGPMHNGTSEVAIAAASGVAAALGPELDVTVLASPEAIGYHGLAARFPGSRLMSDPDLGGEHFDLAFVPHQVFGMSHLGRLNRTAVRLVVWILDLIAVRSPKLGGQRHAEVFRSVLEAADGVLVLSEAGRRDLAAFFGEAALAGGALAPGVVAPAKALAPAPAPIAGLPAPGYRLVVGNSYPHKAIPQALEFLPSDRPNVVFGEGLGGLALPPGTVLVPGGSLDSRAVDQLFRGASVVVIPSIYEGFGLPTVHALAHGLPLVLADTEVNREVVARFGPGSRVHWFRIFSELPGILAGLAGEPGAPAPAPGPRRGWDEVAAETCAYLRRALALPLDLDRLDRRFHRVRTLAAADEEPLDPHRLCRHALDVARSETANTSAHLAATRGGWSFRVGRALIAPLRWALGKPTGPDSGAEPEAMARIVVEDLVKTFRVATREPGLWGAVKGLFSRTHRTMTALDRVSFTIEPGEIVGYIGPNGAGKSTTVKILAGIMVPDSGRVTVDSRIPWEDRIAHVARVGVVFGQRTQLWWDLPVLESFELLREIYAVPAEAYRRNRDELVELLALGPYLDVPVRQLSLGLRMRADLVASLLHAPPLVFLDEPTIGLDAESKLAVRGFITRLNRERGVTVLLTTHDLDDIAAVCSRVLVLGQGRLLWSGSIPALEARVVAERRLVLDLVDPAAVIDDPEVRLVRRDGARVELAFDPARVPAAALVGRLLARYAVRDMTLEGPPIEEVVARLYRETSAP